MVIWKEPFSTSHFLYFTERVKKEKHESGSQIPYKSTFVSIDSPNKLESKKKKCIKGKL